MTPALRLEGVALVRDGRRLLSGVDWQVDPGTSWVVVGANGSGKTSLVRVAALYEHPSEGTVEVLGERLGQTDVRSLRRRVAMVSHAMADMVRPSLTAADVVVCARFGALEPWWHRYEPADHARAREMLARRGVADLADRPFGSLSSGERQRVLLARTLMADPAVVLLDEPSAGLDLAGREELVDVLDAVAADPDAPPTVLVTHHVEEVPPRFTHLLALRRGEVLASGPVDEVLDGPLLSAVFDLPLQVDRTDGRWTARRA